MLQPSLTGVEMLAMVLIFVIAALALASGIGGGGIYVPLLNLLLRFRPHVAVGLSQALICGGALGALMVNARERHPLEPRRPLIDYGLAAFLAPAEMAGAQLGILLNQALPSPVILASMAMLLTALAIKTLRKGFQALEQERRNPRGQRPKDGDEDEHAEQGRLLQPPASAMPAHGDACGDVDWDGERAARCLVMSLLAGVVAGLVGVGGGIVLGPMMLELGVLPQVSSATTGTMVLLTSSSAAAVFLLGGLIPLDYALALGVVALSGGFLGKVGVAIIVRRYHAAALIILLLGSLIGLSMLATTCAGLLDLYSKLQAGSLVASLAIRPPCAA